MDGQWQNDNCKKWNTCRINGKEWMTVMKMPMITMIAKSESWKWHATLEIPRDRHWKNDNGKWHNDGKNDEKGGRKLAANGTITNDDGIKKRKVHRIGKKQIISVHATLWHHTNRQTERQWYISFTIQP